MSDRWSNSTYTLYAVSVLLALVFRQLARTPKGLDQILEHIDLAILVLEAMDECVVARNATAIIRRTLARARKVHQPALEAQHVSSATEAVDAGRTQASSSEEQYQESSGLDIGPDLDWLNSFPFDPQQALFWTEWSHEVDLLGT